MPTRHTVDVDGDKLVAVHHEGGGDRWMLFSHGFVSDKTGSYEGRCERAVDEGYDAVRFDHRGCGESDLRFGEQTLSTRIADLRAVIDHFDPEAYVLFGSSFGGKVVLHTATDADGVEAVVTRAPVTYTDIFDGSLPDGFGGGFAEDLRSYGFEEVERGLDVPVAVFHGRDDETVPLGSVLDAIKGMRVDVLLETYAGESHRFSRESEERMRDRTFGWLKG